MIITGLDLSLTSSGVADIDTDTGKVQLATITSKPPKTGRHPRTGKPLPATLRQRHDRLEGICHELYRLTQKSDLVLMEGPAHGQVTGQHHDRSGLWWLVATRWLADGIPVIEISPTNLKVYATGKGTTDKDKVMLAIANRYRDLVEVTGNDVADALGIAAMGARWVGHPIEQSLPATHLRAMDVLTAWPGGAE